MFTQKEKIINFTDLKTWKLGHELVLEVYNLTKEFPNEERFVLVGQLRRASISITSNIAEGFSRSTAKDKSRFYAMTLGSLMEVQNQLLIARDLGYITDNTYGHISLKIIEIIKMTHGLIKAAFNRS